jgi:hypothetical protein
MYTPSQLLALSPQTFTGRPPSDARQSEEPPPAKAGFKPRCHGADHRAMAARPLGHCRFYGLAELNAAIGELLRQLNDKRSIRGLGVTRRALFEELDRPNLKSLSAQPDCFAEWRVRQVRRLPCRARRPFSI